MSVPTAEHTYSYLAPSAVVEEEGRAEVSLATSGGRAPNPYFFTGFLGAPRQTAQQPLEPTPLTQGADRNYLFNSSNHKTVSRQAAKPRRLPSFSLRLGAFARARL